MRGRQRGIISKILKSGAMGPSHAVLEYNIRELRQKVVTILSK